MRFLVLTATYELRVRRKSHLRDHPSIHSPGGKGVGGSIFRKTPDIGLASYSIIPLRLQHSTCCKENTLSLSPSTLAWERGEGGGGGVKEGTRRGDGERRRYYERRG
jgi:hypothetical protein